jgi:hypothetical protein
MRTYHGMSHTRIYQAWCQMLQRCENAKSPKFRHYGARGITVCESWHEFANFYTDMGDRPDGCSLDRIDNDGPYCKENCRWVGSRAQRLNSRNRSISDQLASTMFAEYRNGLTYTQIAKSHGFDKRGVKRRIDRFAIQNGSNQ